MKKFARVSLALHTFVWFCLATAHGASATELFHDVPKIGWKWGHNHLDLDFGFRYRYENWQAFAPANSDFHAFRARVGLDYRYRETLRFLVQGQLGKFHGLEPDASGEAGLYRAVAGESNPLTIKLRQLVAEVRGGRESWVRFGRDDAHAGRLHRYAAQYSDEGRPDPPRFGASSLERLKIRLSPFQPDKVDIMDSRLHC